MHGHGCRLWNAGTRVLALIASLLRRRESGTICLLVDGALYLAGIMLMRIAFNVPRNEVLASTAPADSGAASLWAGYVTRWTTWNHVRTTAALAAATSFIIAFGY